MAEYITKEQVIEWFRPYGHTDEGIPYYGLVTDIRGMKAATAQEPTITAPVVFPKERVLIFRRYADRRDLLSVLLEYGKEYTFDQIDGLINDFMKGKVK